MSTSVSEDSPIFPPLSENSIDLDFIEKPNQLHSQVYLAKLNHGNNVQRLSITYLSKKRLKIVEVNGNTNSTPSSKDMTPSTPSIPTSSAQFYSTWKTLGTSSNRFVYLKVSIICFSCYINNKDFGTQNIKAVRLNDLLGAQFDITMLSELLEVLATHFVPNGVPALSYLQEIAKHDQMPIIQMFMTLSDRTGMAEWQMRYISVNL